MSDVLDIWSWMSCPGYLLSWKSHSRCMIRAYRCAALDTPLAYIRKKIDPRPPGAQKWAKKVLFGPSTEKSEYTAAKPLKLRSLWHQPISSSSFRSRTTEFLPVASGSKISIFLRYTPLTPIFGVRRIRPNGILSPPYPEVTLDNFSFPVGGLSVGGRSFSGHLPKGHLPEN